jgi:hypothetical protein
VNKNKSVITIIPDKLWNMINSILPTEKPNNTIDCPVIPFRKVMDGILFTFSEPDASGFSKKFSAQKVKAWLKIMLYNKFIIL